MAKTSLSLSLSQESLYTFNIQTDSLQSCLKFHILFMQSFKIIQKWEVKELSSLSWTDTWLYMCILHFQAYFGSFQCHMNISDLNFLFWLDFWLVNCLPWLLSIISFNHTLKTFDCQCLNKCHCSSGKILSALGDN